MRWTTLLAAGVVFVAGSLVRAEAPKGEEFPIMIWDMAPSDPAVLKKIHDCGVTIAGFGSVKSLDAIHAAGLKTIVHDPRTAGYDWSNVDEAKARENVASLVKETKDHPAVFGYYLRDEPPAAYFPGLEKVAKAVREMAPGKWAYINLFPNYANGDQMNVPTYDAYLKRFVETCHPTILSYDHYALMDDGSLRDGYWQNLEQMRGAAIKAGVPFWNIVLACAHFNYREPTEADLRFEAFTTLAYGGKGISYFTYFAPKVGNYRASAIDQFGNETPTWHALQNTNLQVQKLGPVVMKLKSDDVYHFGGVPSLGHGPGEKSLVKAIDGPWVVGDFTHEDGSRYVMLVNKDLKHGLPCSPQWSQKVGKVERVSSYTGEPVAFEGEQVWAAPGQGVLLKVGRP